MASMSSHMHFLVTIAKNAVRLTAQNHQIQEWNFFEMSQKVVHHPRATTL